MILLENAHVIDPASGTDAKQDLLLDGKHIKDIGKPGAFLNAQVNERIDLSNKWLVPGLVDIHVHLREPGFEWKETILSGAKAAVAGGFTTICCMANTNPVNDNAEVTRFIIDKSKFAGLAKVRPLGALSVGLKGENLAPFSEMAHAGCVAFSDDGEPVQNTLLLRRALEWCSMLNTPIALHEEDPYLCENGSMNESALATKLGLHGMPKSAEDLMIARDIELARLTNARLHICHVSSARAVELVRRAKSDGICVSAEATPHHLFLTEDAVIQYDANAKMNPPLREAKDLNVLREALADGTIDCVASDHAPHELDKKRIEFQLAAFGIIGLQTTLSLVLELVREGFLTRLRAIDVLTTGASRVFSLGCGKLEKGGVADITIIDPEKEWVFSEDENLSLSANSPFLGRQMKGKAETVIIDGSIVLKNNTFQ